MRSDLQFSLCSKQINFYTSSPGTIFFPLPKNLVHVTANGTIFNFPDKPPKCHMDRLEMKNISHCAIYHLKLCTLYFSCNFKIQIHTKDYMCNLPSLTQQKYPILFKQRPALYLTLILQLNHTQKY